MSVYDEGDGVLDLRVESMTVEAEGVLTLVLVDPDGGRLPEWTPGAHVDLWLPEVVRQYSLCGDPDDRSRYVVAVLQAPDSRGGSEYIHRLLRPGDRVEVGGPRNHFALRPAKEYLFIAGGIGITPILPMIREADRRGAPWRLVYGGRSRRSMAFLERLRGYGDRVLVWPEDEQGLLDLDTALAANDDGLAVYCCGPAGLIAAVESRCATWPTDAVNFERFTARDLSALSSAPVTVTCARSQLTLEVSAAESILDALEAAGVGVANACRDGVCGSCEVAVLAGTPDHRDSIRSGAELDDTTSLAVCVSRARTPELVLDI
ncbi:PDR/VanB family oxidoreductase [Micromonospora endophytica]|uniref:Oxidoreductase n=1 Tax=Micromonospora endophytica TaxID=515350 RepID=A0A2W2CLX5_9ACTN|nr:PDR/VanB family oxidoreductase [Micromonospora endophytica]PZF92648.1 oxidoreductase [Micromonospora endophytica]RIW49826.1 oxidoreductase [Micromonospora endophytica]BCJ57244.1 ferredoxin [Micromonospora endophytica]